MKVTGIMPEKWLNIFSFRNTENQRFCGATFLRDADAPPIIQGQVCMGRVGEVRAT